MSNDSLSADDVANFCPECGTPARGARRFCGRCGASLIGDDRHPNTEALALASVGTPSAVGGFSPAVAKMVTFQGRAAPLEVWLFVGAAWIGVGLFALLGLLDLRGAVDYLGSFSWWSLLSGLAIAITGIVALTFGALLAWVGLRALKGDSTTPWCGVAVGAVLLVGTLVYALSNQSFGRYPLITLGLVLISAAMIGLAGFSAGVKSHSTNRDEHTPPAPTEVARRLSLVLSLLFGVNGIASFAVFLAYVGYGSAAFKLLLLGLILLSGAGAVFWAAQSLLSGAPTPRLVLSGAAAFAALGYVLLNTNYANDAWYGWVQVCIAVAIIVLLWIPASSEFFRKQIGATR